MDYKEKYEQTLERARKIHNQTEFDYEKGMIEEIFPELKESDDEKIRRGLIEYFNAYPKDYFGGLKKSYILTWLKKQAEQKPIMNVPSREVILSIWDLGNEWKELTNGCISTEYGTQLDYIQKHWHESEYYLRENQGEQTINQPDFEIPFGAKDSELIEESYYIPKGFHAEIIKDRVTIKKGEQKPTWSAEDERNLKGIVDEIEANKNTAPDYDLATYDRFLSWLKSIKERVQPQNTWKPSDAQMASITCAVRKMKESACYDSELVSLYQDLKKLKG